MSAIADLCCEVVLVVSVVSCVSGTEVKSMYSNLVDETVSMSVGVEVVCMSVIADSLRSEFDEFVCEAVVTLSVMRAVDVSFVGVGTAVSV